MSASVPALRYPGAVAAQHPDRPAVILAETGAQMTFAELDAWAWRAARALRALGLQAGDHVAMVIENRLACVALQWGAHYAGLYYTFISTRLTAGEVAYIVGDCGARVVLVTGATAAPAMLDALAGAQEPPIVLSAGGAVEGLEPFEAVLSAQPAEPIPGASEGTDMLYSSGTTGRPKGVKPPLTGLPVGSTLVIADLGKAMTGLDGGDVYLSPAPFYHAAPCKWSLAAVGAGATVVLMTRFDPAGALEAIDRYGVTHSQWVPTHFLRLLRLPEEVRDRHRLSTHRAAIHAAAPCPPEVKRAMIDWWGPILHEYYAGTEAIGMTHCDTEGWLAHPGSVGRPVLGTVRILGDDGRELPVGEEGAIYFESDRSFEYHNDPAKTADAYARPGVATMGDVGRLDADGFLYLTDRRTNMIITGGVNVYPQEAENRLSLHPAVDDVAVIGVPDPEWGETVRAVVQPAPGAQPGEALAAELVAFCRQELASIKCPRQVDFRDELPREPTGKLLKRKLRDEYWAGRNSRL
ncbi:MAG TPA: acyl-CoA synthetase [Solirubrobacteraceae bacterium]|nr:acyl-CoA synthetase [Solirubrobacteraceae bacterium]